MASISIEFVRKIFPGKPDDEVAAEFAKMNGYLLAVKYKNSPNATKHTDFGFCVRPEELDNYYQSGSCFEVKMAYDGRVERAKTKVVYSQDAIERKIAFHEAGQASVPCCWNCRHFTIPLSGDHFCTQHFTQVDRGDLCDYWIKR